MCGPIEQMNTVKPLNEQITRNGIKKKEKTENYNWCRWYNPRILKFTFDKPDRH